MKELFVLLIILLFPTISFAGEFDVSLTPMNISYNSHFFDDDVGVEARLGYKNSFLWVNLQNPGMKYIGQHFGDAQILGVGIGARTPLYWKNFRAYFGLGYFDVRTTIFDNFYNEVADYFFRDYLGEDAIKWNHTAYILEDGIGGMVGGSYIKPVSDWLNVGLSVDYQILRCQQIVLGYNEKDFDPTVPHHEFFEYRILSGLRLGITIQGSVKR